MLVNSPSDFDYLQIGLASPDRIRFWSFGEVEKPETINYRTFKPERRGLFCEKIFGPVKDWECSCGKYRRVRYRGIVCERCGVEVTHSKVRRERMGHIELASDVSHIWFLKGIPSYMGLLLDMSSRQLEEVIYYDSYIVTDVSSAMEGVLEERKVISAIEYNRLKEKYGDQFKADMGASAIKSILKKLDLKNMITDLRSALDESKGQKRLKITKRLRVVEAFFKSGNRPEWMIMEVIPVMPPDLRPMVQLEGGRFATSDLNDLYRRVVNRNNRLKRLMDIGAPEMIVRNEKRMLQEAVDVLISNGKRGRSVTGANGRPLKSLGNIIEGKQGRFRQNLLGKRVDYSGRSVIVVGPQLKFHQCGLPKEMALELFKPFVIRKLVERGISANVKGAKRKIEKREVEVWDVLEEVIEGQPVLLNRAPTLHRLGIQAFEPILVEGSAIQIHPLVCTAFNADFDGDQMAVHVPLSIEAQVECRLLIMSTNNILSPSNGRPIVTPTQDMILGCYFLTVEDTGTPVGKGKWFSEIAEAWRAWDARVIGLQSGIKVRHGSEWLETTIGRVIFNSTIWDVLHKNGIESTPFINDEIGKNRLSDLVLKWFYAYGNDVTAHLIDRIKSIGFKYATLSGISISIDDLKIPPEKPAILEGAYADIRKVDELFDSGSISSRERVLRANDVWRETTAKVLGALESGLGRLNNLHMMANSGARGNFDQVRQLAGMRGLMSDSQGRTVSIPILSNFKEGLTLTEYFISCYGARKGLVDTALRTADSGYLTRRLVDVAQDVMITEEDCGTDGYVDIQAVKDGINIIVPLADMVEGRVTKERILAKDGSVIVDAGEIITESTAKMIQELGRDFVRTRSVYKCAARRGLCQACYGLDLSSGAAINIGEAVGIIAAQSIGEPGTQLTMRTFHTGGVDLRKVSKVDIKTKHVGKVVVSEDLALSRVTDEDGVPIWVTTMEGDIFVDTEFGERRAYLVPVGSSVFVKDGDTVSEATILAEHDAAYEYVISASSGVVRVFGANLKAISAVRGESFSQKDGEIFVFNSEVGVKYSIPVSYSEGVTIGDRLRNEYELSPGVRLTSPGLVSNIEMASTGDDKIAIVTICPGETYFAQSGARFFVSDGDRVRVGQVLAKERVGSADESKTKDIVQGLPRVEELFEARRPKESAVLSEIDGVVSIDEKDGIRVICVMGAENEKKDYKVSYGVRLKVYAGKTVRRGDLLTEGIVSPHDVLKTKGLFATQFYLSDEIQKVYRSQGVKISSKHIEVIVRQMTRKVNVTQMGESDFLPNELIDIRSFERTNLRLVEEGKAPAVGERELLGITRASLYSESFISSASFQQTASVLTKAAIEGQLDPMYGLKENVIIGKLIPAGTGMVFYDRVGVEVEEDQPSLV